MFHYFLKVCQYAIFHVHLKFRSEAKWIFEAATNPLFVFSLLKATPLLDVLLDPYNPFLC